MQMKKLKCFHFEDLMSTHKQTHAAYDFNLLKSLVDAKILFFIFQLAQKNFKWIFFSILENFIIWVIKEEMTTD